MVLNQMPNAGAENIHARRVLEINPSHPIYDTLMKIYQNDSEKLKKYAMLLYSQALLIEGLPVEDPAAFSNQICDLMV